MFLLLVATREYYTIHVLYIIIITLYYTSSQDGDIVCYNDQISFTTLPEEGGEVCIIAIVIIIIIVCCCCCYCYYYYQLSLHSDSFTFANCSQHKRQQTVKLVDEKVFQCDWLVINVHSLLLLFICCCCCLFQENIVF